MTTSISRLCKLQLLHIFFNFTDYSGHIIFGHRLSYLVTVLHTSIANPSHEACTEYMRIVILHSCTLLFFCVRSSHTLTTDTSSIFLSIMSVTCMTKTDQLSLVATIHVDCLAFGFRPWFLSMVASLSCYWTMHTITRWQILRIKVFFECQEHRPVISVALNDHEWFWQHDYF